MDRTHPGLTTPNTLRRSAHEHPPHHRDLDLWLIDKDAEGVTKPGPGVVYDRAGMGIVFMDDRGRDFSFVDTGAALEVFAGQGARLSPALARDLAAALERFADYADGLTGYEPTEATHP